MSFEMKITLASIAVVVLIVGTLAYRRFPKKLKAQAFGDKWQELQSYLKDKSRWAEAMLMADKMLDEALKKRKFKGGSMGERMVSAQRLFTNNDDLWFAHNLCKKLKADEKLVLKEADVKDALIGFRQALRDLGALRESNDVKE